MGSTLAADSKMMFYPTDVFETYRILPLIGTIEYIDSYKMNKDFYINTLGMSKEDYYVITGTALDENIPAKVLFYDWFIKHRVDEVRNYFKLEFQYGNKGIVIADLFCGKGEWLKTFRDFLPSQKTLLVGNEIEEGRYKKAKKGLDYCFNSSFEELQIPKKSISIMLFNPPYGGDMGERNARKYLKEIIDRQYLMAEDYYNRRSVMVMVLRVDDYLDCADIIAKNFDVLNMYKTEPEEFKKYNQLIVIAKIKYRSLGDESVSESIKLLEAINNFKSKVDNCESFNYKNYSFKNYGLNFPESNFSELMENFIFVQNKQDYISKNDNIWKWMQDKTAIYDTGVSQLTMPRPPKLAEIANIIAAGYINSEVTTGDSKHIAVGGIKTLVKKEETRYNDAGKEGLQTTVTKTSVPYLNVLYSVNGKLTIKEICEET